MNPFHFYIFHLGEEKLFILFTYFNHKKNFFLPFIHFFIKKSRERKFCEKGKIILKGKNCLKEEELKGCTKDEKNFISRVLMLIREQKDNITIQEN
jgi:hypothetical protein